jgi:hypothetical protein
MRAIYLPLICCAVTFISCQKQATEQTQPQTAILTDTPVLKLKDMVERNLPSPYYHFDYNDSGYITKAIFASGLSFYDLTYIGKKLSEVAMNKDIPLDTRKDKLKYEYNNGNLTGVNVFDKNGVFYRKCILTFSTSRQLQKLEWDVQIGTAGFKAELIMVFSYYADGNLEKITYSSLPIDTQPSAFYEDKFEDYDNKPNADGFSLLHANPFYLDLVLFPSVRLQLNNPRRVTHTGDGANYMVNYSYTYDAKGRPVEKRGDFVYTNGTSAGIHTDLLTTFSYYD